jgi:hypothetical protein
MVAFLSSTCCSSPPDTEECYSTRSNKERTCCLDLENTFATVSQVASLLAWIAKKEGGRRAWLSGCRPTVISSLPDGIAIHQQPFVFQMPEIRKDK